MRSLGTELDGLATAAYRNRWVDIIDRSARPTAAI
jgi:hypothetical protein